MGKGPFSWIKPVAKAKEDMLVEKLGLDAAVFLRFTRMLRNIFCILGVIGVAIMIPVNITTGTSAIQDKSNVFSIMTPLYTFGEGLWAQVVVAYAIDIVILYFMWRNYRKVHDLRRAYFDSPQYQQSLHARSILIRHIPSNLRNEEGILRITEAISSTGSLPVPIAIRNVKDIPELVDKHEEMVRKLESVLAKYLKHPDRLPSRRPMMKPPKHYAGPTTGGKIDAIDYYRRQIEVLEQNINDMRQQVDHRDILPFGFASWDYVAQAHIAACAARKKGPHHTKIRLAPRPSDIIWRNMPLTRTQLRRKAIMNGIWVTILTILWTPINACLAVFLSNLSNLGSLWPRFQTELVAHKGFWAVVQGIAAPAITSAIYLLLPIIFRRLQIRAGDVTKTERERHVLRNLFNFFILNNLLIFSFFSAIWRYITLVIQNSDSGVWEALKKGDFFLIVTTNLCQSISPFWVTWILQRNLGAAIDLAQVWTLFYQWFAKTFMAPTPRQYIEWTAPQQFQYASYYNYFLFYTAVSLCFATLQPVILLCTALYFAMDSILKKYLLMYVFVTKNESGGQLWRTLIDRMIFSCILADVIIGIVVKARGTWTMALALVPLVIMMLGFKLYCMKTLDPSMDFYQRDPTHFNEHSGAEPSSKSVNRAAARYRHPILDKKLITPMVPAKAKHIVQQIYSGRLGSDVGHGPATFSDIPMETFKFNAQPHSSMPFEAVPEGQQDYAFYKNRADFGNVGGDRLGRMGDLIISRPGTPNTLASGAQTPYMDSRPSSPAPQIMRKEVASGSVHPALRSQTSRYSQLTKIESNDGDISLHPTHGPYTDPNDDQEYLLRGGSNGRHPNDDFLTMDQWRAPGTPYSQGDGPGGYDYFRSSGMR